MKDKLSLTVLRFDNVLVVKDIYLDEELRNTLEDIESGEVRLRRSKTGRSEMTLEYLYIGSGHSTTSYSYKDINKARRMKNDIEECVRLFNEQEREKEKPNNRFGLKKGDKYWYLMTDGTVSSQSWNGTSSDEFRANHNYLARTREDIERYKECLEVIHRNEKIFTEKEWGSIDIDKWYILFNHDSSSRCSVCVQFRHESAKHHFETEEIAKEVLYFIGDKDYKKYFCKVGL